MKNILQILWGREDIKNMTDLNKNYTQMAEEIVANWKEDGYEYVAISSKDGSCYPVDKGLLSAMTDNAFPYTTLGYSKIPQIGGDIFFNIDTKEIKAAIIKSLGYGHSYHLLNTGSRGG